MQTKKGLNHWSRVLLAAFVFAGGVTLFSKEAKEPPPPPTAIEKTQKAFNDAGKYALKLWGEVQKDAAEVAEEVRHRTECSVTGARKAVENRSIGDGTAAYNKCRNRWNIFPTW